MFTSTNEVAPRQCIVFVPPAAASATSEGDNAAAAEHVDLTENVATLTSSLAEPSVAKPLLELWDNLKFDNVPYNHNRALPGQHGGLDRLHGRLQLPSPEQGLQLFSRFLLQVVQAPTTHSTKVSPTLQRLSCTSE